MPLCIHSHFSIFTSIDLLHDKAGMFSYIIVGRSMHGECCIYAMEPSVSTSRISQKVLSEKSQKEPSVMVKGLRSAQQVSSSSQDVHLL